MAKKPPPSSIIAKELIWDYEKISRLAKSQFTIQQICQYIGIEGANFRERLKTDPYLREVLYTSRLGVIDEVARAVIESATTKNDRDAQKIILRKAGWFDDVTKAKALQLRVKELELKNEELQLKYLSLMTPEQIEEKALEILAEQNKIKDKQSN